MTDFIKWARISICTGFFNGKMLREDTRQSLCAINGTQRGFVAKITPNMGKDMAVLVTLDTFEPNVGEKHCCRFDDGSECEIFVTDTTFCLISRVLHVTVIELNLKDHDHLDRLLEIDDKIKLTGPYTGKKEVIKIFKNFHRFEHLHAWGLRVAHSECAVKPGEPLVGTNGRVFAVNVDKQSSVLMCQIAGAIERCFELGHTSRLVDIELDELPEDKRRELEGMELLPVPEHRLMYKSPANEKRTELVFLRTKMGWFWAPKAPEYNIDKHQWTPIWEGYQMTAIGSPYDGHKPEQSNWPKIENLAKSGGRFL